MSPSAASGTVSRVKDRLMPDTDSPPDDQRDGEQEAGGGDLQWQTGCWPTLGIRLQESSACCSVLHRPGCYTPSQSIVGAIYLVRVPDPPYFKSVGEPDYNISTWKEQEDLICMLEMLSKDTDWLICKSWSWSW